MSAASFVLAEGLPFAAGLPAAEGVMSRADDSARTRLAALFRAHWELVYRLVRRLGVPTHSAEDAAQQVFVVAAERLADIRAGSERAFLYGASLHVARSARRRWARELPTDGADEVGALQPTQDELVEQRRARELLDTLLAQLEEDVREVFVLYELESLTMREISELLGLPAGTVASRLRRGRERFEALCERKGARS